MFNTDLHIEFFFSFKHDETTFPRQVAKSYLNIQNFKNLPWEQNYFQQLRIFMETHL